VPNILPVEGYGQTTFVATLLSFMTFADFGLSFVYGRKMPAIYASGNNQEEQRWNETVFTFRMLMSLIFGILISSIYFFKYQVLINAIVLVFIPPLSVIVSFYVAQITAKSSFASYRKINNYQAIARLAIIPGVILLGVFGWFFAQLITNLLTVFKVLRGGWLSGKLNIDWLLIKEHFAEAIILGAITTLWVQLLASGKVFASFLYPDAVIAHYGLINGGYQIVASLIISAFIPQTVDIYKLVGTNTQEAIEYVFKIILRAIPIVFGLTVVFREVAPYVLSNFFPKYHVDPLILDGLIFSLPVYPIIVTIGAVLIAKKKSIPYLLLIAFSIALNWTILITIESYYESTAAAVAQLCTLYLYSALLLILMHSFVKEHIKNLTIKLLEIYGSLTGLFAVYFFIKYLLLK
jgi:hypothetical protein